MNQPDPPVHLPSTFTDPAAARVEAMLASANHFCQTAGRGKHGVASTGEKAAHRLAKMMLKYREDFAAIDPQLLEGALNTIRLYAAHGGDAVIGPMVNFAAGTKPKNQNRRRSW